MSLYWRFVQYCATDIWRKRSVSPYFAIMCRRRKVVINWRKWKILTYSFSASFHSKEYSIKNVTGDLGNVVHCRRDFHTKDSFLLYARYLPNHCDLCLVYWPSCLNLYYIHPTAATNVAFFSTNTTGNMDSYENLDTDKLL